MLLQAILQKDEIRLWDKTILFKKETLSVDVLGKLLLHLDNELAEQEKGEMLALLSSNSAVSREWELLQYTRFISESSLVFDEKQSLYSKEKEKPAILPWRKLMAAAVVVGIGFWGYFYYLNTSSKANEPLILNEANRLASVKMDKAASNLLSNTSPTSTADIKSKQRSQPVIPRALFTKKTRKHSAIGSFSPTESTMKSLPASPPANLLPITFPEKIDPAETGKIIASNLLTGKQEPRLTQLRENGIVMNESMDNSFISTASFEEDGEENNNQVLFVGEEKIKKTSLGVLFKKIKRVVQRNIQLTGAGKNFKVANFEFAIH